MSRVFIASYNSRFDTPVTRSALEVYGAIEYLLGNGTPFPSPLRLHEYYTTIKSQLLLVDFDVHADFIALTGSTLQVSLLMSAALTEYGDVSFLVFDAANERYIERSLCVA